MTNKMIYMANIESIFHELAEMHLTKSNRSKIAKLLELAVVSGCEAAGNGDKDQALDKASHLTRECSK